MGTPLPAQIAGHAGQPAPGPAPSGIPGTPSTHADISRQSAATAHDRLYAVPVLNRLRVSPWLRAGVLAVFAVGCCYGLVSQWPETHAALSQLNWLPVAGAGLAALAGSGCMLLAWRTLLADLGSPLTVTAATRVISVSALGKYLPGAVWAFAAQLELARDYEVPRRRCATTLITSVAVTLGVGLVVAAVALSLTSTAAAARYWWVLAVAPLVLALLWPPVLGRAIDLVLRALRRAPLERRPTAGGIARAAAWTAAGWLLWGTQAWLLLRDVTGKGLGVLLVSLGAYALAWSAGTMAVIFPGGIGPRELALIAALAPVAARGPALVVAVLSRLLMTGSDLAWGGAGLWIGRRLARLIRQAAEQAAENAAGPGADPGYASGGAAVP
jgi:hypothetical protein